MYNAVDLMNTQVLTARPEWTVRRVGEVLLDEGVDALPVVDGSGRMVGWVPEACLLLAVIDPQHSGDPISLHMERKFPTLHPSEGLGPMTEKFLLHRCACLPVVEDRRLLGVVTRRDLMRAVMGRQTTASAAANTSA